MKNIQILLEQFIQAHPDDAIKILEQQEIEDICELFGDLSLSVTVQLLKRLEPFTSIKCLEEMDPEKTAIIAVKLPIQIISSFLNKVDPEKRDEVLNKIPEEISVLLKRRMEYPAESAGALSDPFVLTLPVDITVKEALKRIQSRDSKTNYFIYVVNRNQELSGVTSLKKLLHANPGTPLVAIINKNVTTLNANMNIESIIKNSGWNISHVLPVIDENNMLLGIIRYQALNQFIEEKKIYGTKSQVINTTNALCELYQIGLSGLFKTAITLFKEQPKTINT